MNSALKKIFSSLCHRAKKNSQLQRRTYDIALGANSSLETPMQINGGKYIKIGNQSSIGHNAWLGAFDAYLNQKYTPEIVIGNNVRIGNYACITAIDRIEIGDGCLFSEYIYISDHGHGFNPTTGLSPKDQDLNSKGPVKIGENTFLGYRVCVLPDVTIGRNCVVGSNSVVTKSFPDYTMLAGVPAKAIKRFSFEQNEWINIKQE